MAVVDARYYFTMVDVGDYDIPGTCGPAMLYVFVGDEAFLLLSYLIRPCLEETISIRQEEPIQNNF